MNRFSLPALLAVSALALAACSIEQPDSGSSQDAAAAECGPGRDHLIGMSQANNAEPYREVMNTDIETAASAVDGLR
jgi:ribose transport system substrate-binding protein